MKVNYKHSVSLTKVVDEYRVNGTGISVIQEKWQDFEAGQPMEGRIEDGFFVKDMNVFLGKNWEYWFIPLNNVSLELDGRKINFHPEHEGVMRFGVTEIPIIISLFRWC